MPQGTGERWTTLRLLEWTQKFFAARGLPEARWEAELLLGEVLGYSRVELYLHFDEEVPGPARRRYREMVRRRAAHWPLQYLLGRVEFRELTLRILPGVFIPRPETETLVEVALRYLAGHSGEPPPRFADLGTGCGAVAIALLKENAAALGAASDISPHALDLARENAEAAGVADRLAFARGDLFSAFADRVPPEAFDLIVSNPPYLEETLRDQLPPEVRDFEPPEALFGGPDGLAVIRRLVPGAVSYLRPGGTLAFEIGAGQAERVEQIVRETPRLELRETAPDLAGIPRVVVARKRER